MSGIRGTAHTYPHVHTDRHVHQLQQLTPKLTLTLSHSHTLTQHAPSSSDSTWQAYSLPYVGVAGSPLAAFRSNQDCHALSHPNRFIPYPVHRWAQPCDPLQTTLLFLPVFFNRYFCPPSLGVNTPWPPAPACDLPSCFPGGTQPPRCVGTLCPSLSGALSLTHTTHIFQAFQANLIFCTYYSIYSKICLLFAFIRHCNVNTVSLSTITLSILITFPILLLSLTN